MAKAVPKEEGDSEICTLAYSVLSMRQIRLIEAKCFGFMVKFPLTRQFYVVLSLKRLETRDRTSKSHRMLVGSLSPKG